MTTADPVGRLSQALKKAVGQIASLSEEARAHREGVEREFVVHDANVAKLFDMIWENVLELQADVATLRAENHKLHDQVRLLEEIMADHETALIGTGKPLCPSLLEDDEAVPQPVAVEGHQDALEPGLKQHDLEAEVLGTPLPPICEDQVRAMTRQREYAHVRAYRGY